MSIRFEDIRRAVIGEGQSIPGPFGPRPMLYADYVASGRSLGFIEDAVRAHVLPFYGNTHTETSFSGRNSTRLREMARRAVRRATGADDGHAVIFTGSGTTAAADKLIRALSMNGLAGDAVVFVGPYEHHSNDLPWRECGALVERIPLDAQGGIDIAVLAERLAAHQGRALRIGAFSAASNVTGVMTDLRAIAKLLHDHDAWCIADFAAAAPYIPMNLAESVPGAGDRIDAAFISTHKFVGGPGASGLLICDRRLLDLPRPTISGGGTVSYVTASAHRYVTDPERREEAGTPAIVGDIRAGMVMELKHSFGAEAITRGEAAMTERMEHGLRAIPGLELLGPANRPRVGIFSFNIRIGDRVLHHNDVVALLNDIFGIQARGGCSCAGPYGHTLLDLDDARTSQHEAAVALGDSAFRPGWARLGVNWFFSDQDVDRILAALGFIARHGLDLLPLYHLDVRAGVWRANRLVDETPPATLADLWTRKAPDHGPAPDFDTVMAEAEALVAEARDLPIPGIQPLPPEEEALRWFWMPHEARKEARA